MAGEIVKVDGVWNLTAETAKRLGIKPDKLLNHFAKDYLKPYLQNAASKKIKELGRDLKPHEISKLREGFGKVIFNGEQRNLSNINEYFRNPDDTTAGQLLTKKGVDLRGERAVGMGPTGELQATFYDNIAKFEAQRDKSLSQASNPRQESKIYQRFDNQMTNLFNKNRKWLPKDAHYDPLTYEDQYGWKDGQSREDYFAWQRKVYADSQSMSRAAFQKYGVNFDAGHLKALGELKISKEEFNGLPQTVQNLLKDGGEPDPKNKGGWLIYGTNAASNLAIQIAKHNRANKNFDSRNIEDLLNINAAFTKTLAFNEYLLKDDNTFRKNTDYEQSIRSLLAHNQHLDVNAVISKAEDRFINEGPEEAKLQKFKVPTQKDSLKIFDNQNEVKSYNIDPRRLETENLGSSDLEQFSLPNSQGLFKPNKSGVLTIGGVDQPGAKDSLEYVQKELPKAAAEHGVNLLGARTGNKQIGTQLRRGIEAVNLVKKGDNVGAAVSAYQAVSPGITTQSKLTISRRGLLEQSAKSLLEERNWNSPP